MTLSPSRVVQVAMHVHSTYSDGEMPIREVRDRLVAHGFRVICMADHADTFDEEKLARYGKECRDLSGDDVLMFPGLEFTCRDRMHIVGYGVQALTPSDDAAVVIEHIHKAGGVSVIAHPALRHLERIAEFTVLPDGIEIWNTKYDGSAAPRPAVIELLRRMQSRKADLRAFYGLDLHWRHQFRDLFVEMTVDSIDSQGLLRALRSGAYVGMANGWTLPSSGDFPPDRLSEFGAKSARSLGWRQVVRNLKRLAGPIGRALPPSVKSQLRRFF